MSKEHHSYLLFVKLGVSIGILHHFLVQYPRQVSFFTTAFCFIGVNAVFIIVVSSPLTWQPPKTLSGVVEGFLVFSSCYVIPAAVRTVNLPQFVTALFLKIIYNIYFRHRRIPTKFWLAATDLG